MPERSDLVVRNATLVSPEGLRTMDIGITRGRFSSLTARGEIGFEGSERNLDATGLIAMPGLIDAHVHFREPGLEYKEDWDTGSRAAVMGGVTTVLDMPNTVPPTDTHDRAREKLSIADASSFCDFGLLGLPNADVAAVADLCGSGYVRGLKVFMGPTSGGLSAPSDAHLRAILGIAARAGMRVAFHAEDESVINEVVEAIRGSGRSDARAHLDSRPIEAEVRAIDHVGRLLSAAGARGHVLHLSSAEGVAAVRRWQAEGLDLTSETTAHHCFLNVHVYDTAGGLAKVNPPIRGKPDSSALLGALASGQIDTIGSDHAPHTAAEKAKPDIWSVPSGFAGVEISLRLFLTAVNDGRLTLERLTYLMSEGPARTWGLWPRKGAVAIGSDADLTLVDVVRPGVIHAAELHGRNNATPFEGWPTRGAPVATIVRGRVVMRDGELLAEPGWGRPVTRGSS